MFCGAGRPLPRAGWGIVPCPVWLCGCQMSTVVFAVQYLVSTTTHELPATFFQASLQLCRHALPFTGSCMTQILMIRNHTPLYSLTLHLINYDAPVIRLIKTADMREKLTISSYAGELP